MTVGGTVIELGTAHGAVDEDAPPPPCHRRTAARARLATASAVLLLLCAAATPAQATLRQAVVVPAAPGASVSVVGDLLVVADPHAPGGPGTYVTAYALPGGMPRWTVRMPATAPHTAERAGEVLLVAERDPLRRRAATTALSARTGEVRWRRIGAVVTAENAPVGLAVSEVPGAGAPGRRIEGFVEAVDLASGWTRWSTTLPSSAVVAVVAQPAVAVVVHDSGRAEVRDLVTGGIRGVRGLPPADYAPDNPRQAGRTLVLRHPESGRDVLTGYDLPTLDVRWSRSAGTAPDVRWAGCGDRLCARTPEVNWTLDPATGAASVAPGDGGIWRSVRGSGDRLVARDLDDQRLLLATDQSPAGPRTIGALPPGHRDCRAGGVALVCRVEPAGLAVFALPTVRITP